MSYSFDAENGQLVIEEDNMQLSLKAETPSIIRVRYGKLEAVTRPMYHLQYTAKAVAVSVAEEENNYQFQTDLLTVAYDKSKRLLRFADRISGAMLLEESLREVEPVTCFGEKTFQLNQVFKTDPEEFISGAGFQQDELVDYSGRYAYLVQWNNSGTVPFYQSTRNWAILWNNTSLTELNPDPIRLPINQTVNDEETLAFTAEETGTYTFSIRRKTEESFGRVQVTLDDRVLFKTQPGWPGMVFSAAIDLEKGKTYTIRAIGNFEAVYHPPSARQHMHLRSEMGECIDYHFVAGATADERIAGYRFLTGDAPLFPAWAFGFFQSKERYDTAQELLDVVATFRQKNIPIDCIVQDWRYWGEHGWNALRFDENRFPEMESVIQTLHDKHARLMISVWPNFGDPENGSLDNLERFESNGWLLKRSEFAGENAPPTRPTTAWTGFIDYFNPEAAAAFWQMVEHNLLRVGVDAWWLDATEPNFDGYQGGLRYYTSHQGSGAYWLNLYPLMHSMNMYEGQRKASDAKRVFILGRTPFAGIQRYGTVVWSGDTAADWDTFRRQLAAGITASYSGIPYYCADIGGFAMLKNTNPAHRLLYTRWFQFGAFSPIFRAHGTSCPREPWQFGKESEAIQIKYLQLRSRLQPYLYSEAARITFENGTMMRGLMMDFPNDENACKSAISYMFGHAFLVSPVLETDSQDKPGTLIPSEVLFDKHQQTGGLSVSYYNDINLETLAHEDKELVVDYTCDNRNQEHLEAQMDGKITGLHEEQISARWEGFVNIEQTGNYQFIVAAKDGIRLWIDGELVLDVWKRQGENVHAAEVTIPSPGMVALKMEYFQQENYGSAQLRWLQPGMKIKQKTTWPVYLPQECLWYNFWTETSYEGGQAIETEAPLDTLPLYVRAGSIIPLGPVQEWIGQETDEELEIRIYPGADGTFTLYEDEGDSYRYEQGACSRIPIAWQDQDSTLVIGQRQGTYPGMLEKRKFTLNIIGDECKDIDYDGTEQTITFR